MKVLHITSSFMPPKKDGDLEHSKLANNDEGIYTGARVGGFASVIDSMAKNLDFEHHVLLSQGLFNHQQGVWSGLKNVEVRDGLHIHYFPNSGDVGGLEKVNYTFKGILEHEYDDFKFDVVITHVVNPSIDLSGTQKKCRWVNFTHGSKTNADLSRQYMRLIDANVLFSEHQRKNVSDNSKSVVLPFPVNTDVFYPRNPSPANDFVWCGRIAPEKKIIDFAVRFEDEVDSEFFVIGGPDNIAWKSDIENSDLEKVHFLGRLFDESLANELSNHQYFVLMSDYESYCVALLEALSAGCTAYVIKREGLMWAEGLVHFVDDMDELIESIKNPVPLNVFDEVKSRLSWDSMRSEYERVLGKD